MEPVDVLKKVLLLRNQHLICDDFGPWDLHCGTDIGLNRSYCPSMEREEVTLKRGLESVEGIVKVYTNGKLPAGEVLLLVPTRG